jgi:hypothetical protein
MKRAKASLSRRQFAQLAGAAAMAAPALAQTPTPTPAQAATPQQTPPAEVKPKYGMTKEQEEQVKQSVERVDRGRTALRSHPLNYASEPSFVFSARPSRGRK